MWYHIYSCRSLQIKKKKDIYRTLGDSLWNSRLTDIILWVRSKLDQLLPLSYNRFYWQQEKNFRTIKSKLFGVGVGGFHCCDRASQDTSNLSPCTKPNKNLANNQIINDFIKLFNWTVIATSFFYCKNVYGYFCLSLGYTI